MRKTLDRVHNAGRAMLGAATLLEGATPHEVVWRSGPVSLRSYAPDPEADVAAGEVTPLLLVMPIINRYRVVDLHPEATLVGSLTRRGIPVYLVDWGAPRRIDQGIDFEDYVGRYLTRALEVVAGREGGEQVDLAGYCLGGTLAILFAATYPERVRRLVTLTAPVDFRCGQPHMDLLGQWIEPEHFPLEQVTRAFGNMPGGLIQQGFLWPTPVGTALKMSRAWPRFSDPGFASFFTVLESWNNDAVDVPGAAYRRLINDLYRENRLAEGIFELDGAPVDLRRIRCPLLVVTADQDTICPPPAATALLDRVGSEERKHLPLRGGHIAPICGPKAQKTLHEPLADWLLGRGEEPNQPA